MLSIIVRISFQRGKEKIRSTKRKSVETIYSGRVYPIEWIYIVYFYRRNGSHFLPNVFQRIFLHINTTPSTFDITDLEFREIFLFFSFLSIYPTKYVCIYFTRTNMYNRRNTAECIERFYYIIAFRDIHFLNNERMRKERINPYYLINFDRFGHDPIRWRSGKIKLSDWTRLYCKVIFAHVCIYLIFAKKKKKKKRNPLIFLSKHLRV